MEKIIAFGKVFLGYAGKFYKLVGPRFFKVVKFFLPKTIWGWLALIVAAVVVCALLYGVFGNGLGTGEGEGNSQQIEQQDESVSEKTDVIQDESKQEEADAYEGAILDVSVMENDYVYNNEKIALDDLVAKIQSIEGKCIVRVSDQNASLKAYNKLLEKLDECDIDYTEK